MITGTSRQLDILRALTAQLQGIIPANGFPFDLSQSVFRGRSVYGNEDPLPMVSILESPRPGITTVATDDKVTRKTNWELLVQGWVEDDPVNPVDPAYLLRSCCEYQLARTVVQRGDGIKAYMFPSEALLGKLPSGEYRISGMTIGPGVCRPPTPQLSAKAFFYLPLTLQYKEDLSNPFV